MVTVFGPLRLHHDGWFLERMIFCPLLKLDLLIAVHVSRIVGLRTADVIWLKESGTGRDGIEHFLRSALVTVLLIHRVSNVLDADTAVRHEDHIVGLADLYASVRLFWLENDLR